MIDCWDLTVIKRQKITMVSNHGYSATRVTKRTRKITKFFAGDNF